MNGHRNVFFSGPFGSNAMLDKTSNKMSKDTPPATMVPMLQIQNANLNTCCEKRAWIWWEIVVKTCSYIYICICLYIYMNVYIYIYVYIYMYVCMHACMHACMDKLVRHDLQIFFWGINIGKKITKQNRDISWIEMKIVHTHGSRNPNMYCTYI